MDRHKLVGEIGEAIFKALAKANWKDSGDVADTVIATVEATALVIGSFLDTMTEEHPTREAKIREGARLISRTFGEKLNDVVTSALDGTLQEEKTQ